VFTHARLQITHDEVAPEAAWRLCNKGAGQYMYTALACAWRLKTRDEDECQQALTNIDQEQRQQSLQHRRQPLITKASQKPLAVLPIGAALVHELVVPGCWWGEAARACLETRV